MKWWKALIAGGLILGAAGITAAGMRNRPPPMVDAQVTSARRGSITRTITGAGKVQAATTVKISSNLSGDLIELKVKEGERVTKGQVLGRIDRRRYEAAVKQAQAAQAAARSEVQVAQVEVDRVSADLKRVEALGSKELASSAEVDQARALRDSAAGRLAAAQQRMAQASAVFDEQQSNLANTTLLSPIEGNVIELSREVGERVRGSDFTEDVVMTIAALNIMEVRFEVGEHEVVHLKPGQPAEISVDALEGETYQGAVVEIAQKALIKNPGTEAEVTTFPVTVALSTRPARVLPGMSAEVRISAERHDDTVLVPIQAVTVRPEKSLPDYKPPVEGGSLTVARRGETLTKVIFLVDENNKVRARSVRTGIASDTDLEILDGVKEGERLVEGPYRTLSKDLKTGDQVKVPEQTPPAAQGSKS